MCIRDSPEYTINRKTKHHSISQFKLELESADRFFEEQREKILQEANRKQQEEQKIKGGEEGKPYEEKKPVNYKIQKPNKVLASREDVNEYIDGIKRELLEIIDNNKTIIIK